MDLFIIYLILFSIILIIGQLFEKTNSSLALILVIVGMLLSFIPFFPTIQLDPTLVLNVFLPLLIYEISAFSSWRDMKKQLRPIALLSVGHVLFITLLIAITIHTLIPQMGWPLSFVLGAIVSPPDNFAFVAMAKKLYIPERIFIILEGEGMFNDAAALTLFRFALAADISNQYSLFSSFYTLILMIIGEIIYGLVLGHIIGILRTKMTNTSLHFIASFLTPFLAYIPVVKLGGSGIMSIAVVGFIIGNKYMLTFTPAYRVTSFLIWPTLSFAIQSLIFLLVGLNLQSTYAHISSISFTSLIEYVLAIVSVVIIGRFIWVYGFVIILPRLIFPSLSKKDPYPPWQYPFIISWSGIRGGVSLAAALAIPPLALKVDTIDLQDLFIFLVFSVIFATFILQGLSLPIILKKMHIDKVGKSERCKEHLTELEARTQLINAALSWLHKQKKDVKKDEKLFDELSFHIHEYQMLKDQFKLKILNLKRHSVHHEKTDIEELSLLYQLIEIEKNELAKLWQHDKINLRTRNKLLLLLDHQIQRHII